LAAYDAAAAMVPEKNAYRILRKFILELKLTWSPPPKGQSPQPKEPDSVKLKEKPEFTGYEKERIEGQLKKMQQKLDKLTREQGKLQWSLENFLEQQAEKKAAQKSSDSKTSESGTEKQDQDGESSGQKAESTSDGQSTGDGRDGSQKQDSSAKSQGTGKGSGDSGASESEKNESANQENAQGRSPEQNKSESDSQSSGDSQDGAGKQSSSPGSQSGGKSAGASGSSESRQNDSASREKAQGHSSGEGKSASEAQGSTGGKSADQGGADAQRQGSGQDGGANAEARLRMLQAKQRALQEQVSQLKRELQQLPESSDGGKGRAETLQHLDEAGASMDEFQTEMAEARFQAEMDEQRSNKAVALMDSAKRELDMANKTLGRELTLSDDEKLAQQAQEMAEQLAEDADALAESVTDVDRQEMLARLEAAKRLLEMMPEPQWSTVGKGGAAQSGAGRVLTKNPNLASGEMARQMARQFWSIAIDAKKRRQKWIDDEPSDVEFYGQENEFFENAARYDQEPVKK